MPTNTPNLNLTTYDVATEGSVLFISAWENLIGTLSTSNMNKLDGFAGTTTATLQLLQDRPGSTHISATTADGVNYTATVSGLTSLSSGMIIYLEPDDVNTGNPYLNINSLGNKTVYKIDVDGVAVQLEPGDLIPTRKILLVYDGFSWYATGGVNLSDYKISGAIDSLIAIGSSNQPVASSIVLSGGKIGAESIKFDSTLNKDVNNNLMLGDSGITAGTYKGTTYDKFGRATASSGKVQATEINHSTRLTEASGILDLSTTGITAGTYKGLTLDAYGRVTGTNNLVQANEISIDSSLKNTMGVLGVSLAPDSSKLGGQLPSYYLSATGKAADSDKLDGLDSTAFGRPVFLTTPLTSTSWDGDTKGTGDRAVVDLSAVFGVPAGVKAVLMSIQTTADTANDYIRFGPNATYNYALTCRTTVNSQIAHGSGIVPCDANGDVYCYPSTTIEGVYVWIWGYWL